MSKEWVRERENLRDPLKWIFFFFYFMKSRRVKQHTAHKKNTEVEGERDAKQKRRKNSWKIEFQLNYVGRERSQ